MKKISSIFDAFPSRKRPAAAEDLQCSQEDHVMQHEETKKCDRQHTHGYDSFIRKNVLCNLCGLKQKR